MLLLSVGVCVLLFLLQPLLLLSLKLQGLLPQLDPPPLLSPLSFKAVVKGRLLLRETLQRTEEKQPGGASGSKKTNMVILLASVDLPKI